MYKNILVPLDGSGLAEHALRPAVAAAKDSGARISLIHIEHSASPGLALLPGPDEYLKQIADFLSADLRQPVDTAVIRPARYYSITRADIAQLIAKHAKDHGVDLIVMSTKGQGGMARLFFGSVADSLLRVAPCPLLLVRPRDTLPVVKLALSRAYANTP